jgi:CHAT domain-containing protein
MKNAIDRVISSYTPTIKALGYARQQNMRVANIEFQRAMLVGMPATPGLDYGNLPDVEKETNDLYRLLSPRIATTVIRRPNKINVLAALQDHQIVHFACHGVLSLVSPSESTLLLHDWKDNPLTVSDLTTLNLRFAQFAFLSACYSATSRDFRLLSESINLSSAFQLACYPSVVGTLWQVGVENSWEITNELYSQILVGNKLVGELAAESLNNAVRRLREKTRNVPGFAMTVQDDPLVWAPYAHLGI